MFAHSSESTNTNPERFTGLTYPDKESTEFLKAVLTSMNIKYTETTKQNGQYIQWASDNEVQEIEIQNRVGQYDFIRKVCNNLPLPLPSAPSRKELSC